MIKVVIVGHSDYQRAWIYSHAKEYVKVNKAQGRFFMKDGSETFLLLADYLGCDERLCGRTIDQIEVFGPWNEYVNRAVETANLCMRRSSVNA